MTKYKVVLHIESEVEITDPSEVKEKCWEAVSKPFEQSIFDRDSELYGKEEEFLTITEVNDSQSLTFKQMMINEIKKNGGCGKKICVKDGGSNHGSYCGCRYKGLHLCRMCELKANIKDEKERLTMGGGPTSEMYIEQYQKELDALVLEGES